MKIINSLNELNLIEEELPLFFHANYLNTDIDSRSCVAILCDSNRNYIIPVKFTKLRFLKTAKLLCEPFQINNNSTITEIEFFNELFAYLTFNKLSDVVLPPFHFSLINSIPSNVFYYKMGRIIVDLTLSEDEILNKFHKDYRKQIRKCESLGIEVKFSVDLLNDFYEVYQLTHAKQKKEYLPIEYFSNLIHELGDRVVVGVAYLDQKIEGAIFIIKDKETAYSLHSGTAENPLFKGSNKFLMWETFNYLKSRGVQRYNYGGYRESINENSKLGKIAEFKLRFGAEIEYGYHFIKIINPLKYKLFLFLLKIKTILTRTEQSLINLEGLEVKQSK